MVSVVAVFKGRRSHFSQRRREAGHPAAQWTSLAVFARSHLSQEASTGLKITDNRSNVRL